MLIKKSLIAVTNKVITSNLSCYNLANTFPVFLMHRLHVTSIVKSKYSKSCYWNNPVNVIIFCCTESILLTGFHCK